MSDEKTVLKCPCCGEVMNEVSRNERAVKYRCIGCGMSDLKLN